jgi:sugar phosphate isomerase/epimerase
LETPVAVVGELAPFVRSLHVKDFKIERVESRMGYSVTGCAVGDGMLNIGWLLDELRAAGSTPNMIIELWTPYSGSVEKTIDLEQEWATRSVSFLKRFAC